MGSRTGGAKEDCAGWLVAHSYSGRCLELDGVVLRLEAKLNYTWVHVEIVVLFSHFHCIAPGSCRGYAEKAAYQDSAKSADSVCLCHTLSRLSQGQVGGREVCPVGTIL